MTELKSKSEQKEPTLPALISIFAHSQRNCGPFLVAIRLREELRSVQCENNVLNIAADCLPKLEASLQQLKTKNAELCDSTAAILAENTQLLTEKDAIQKTAVQNFERYEAWSMKH